MKIRGFELRGYRILGFDFSTGLHNSSKDLVLSFYFWRWELSIYFWSHNVQNS